MSDTENQVPIIAHLDDISRELATRAFGGTSFDPEKRGEARRREYAEAVNGLYAELWPLAKTEEQRAILAAEMERYREGYRKHLTAYLSSHSNVVSAMIAGPANFPTARMQKRGQWADNKAEALYTWEAKARAAIVDMVKASRSEEDKLEERWGKVSATLTGFLDVIASIDCGASPRSRENYAGSLTGDVRRLALAGEVELVERSQQLVRDYNATHAKPAVAEGGSFWSYADLARQKAAEALAVAEKKANALPDVIARGDGVEIVSNHHADRVQIIFAEKPSPQLIAALKGEAWNWSRTQGAWQRKLTEAAKASAKRITGLVARPPEA